MEYEKALQSLETIIASMDSAIKEFWKNYTGMMVSVGRVFGGEAVKRSLAEDVKQLLKEIEEIMPMEFEMSGDVIKVKRCVVKDLMEKGVLKEDNTICPFIKGFISKMFESIGVKATCDKCEIKVIG